MATATPENAATTTAAAAAGARKDDAAEVLRMVLGEGVVAALHEGFLMGGDFTAVVPLLVGAGAKPYLASAARAALATACDSGLAGVARLLLEADGVRAEDADVGSTHGGSHTLLSAAADRGDVGVVRALIGSGKASVNRVNDGGDPPLVAAASCGRMACVEALLAAPAIDVCAVDEDADCALVVAAQHGLTGCVVMLLAADGIDVNQNDGSGRTALVEAAAAGHAESVAALLASDGVDANLASASGYTALQLAAGAGNLACVRALLAVQDIDVNHVDDGEQNSAITEAAEGNALECVRALVATKIDLGHHNAEHGWTALHYACSGIDGQTAEMVSLLLVAGSCRFSPEASPATSRKTPLELASDNKEVRAVFLSGVDYWQRRRHIGHGWAMKEIVRTLLLVRQRLGTHALANPAHAAGGLPHLPEEIWLAALGFLRSADFMPSN